MKQIISSGIKYFIGMPIVSKISLIVDDHSISLSDNSGYRLEIKLSEEMKKEIAKEWKANAKKERSSKK